MKDPKYFVIREVGSNDRQPYAVVSHDIHGHGHSKNLKVWGWFEREDDARACAHGYLFPD